MSREEMIKWIMLMCGWEESVFRNMSDDKVREIYRDRVEKTMDVSG